MVHGCNQTDTKSRAFEDALLFVVARNEIKPKVRASYNNNTICFVGVHVERKASSLSTCIQSIMKQMHIIHPSKYLSNMFS
jgi:hypothetical protein